MGEKMKVYAVICSQGPAVGPAFQLFKRKADANKAACALVRELRQPGKTFPTGSIHKDGMCTLHYGCRNGYHLACTVAVDQRESRNYPGYKINEAAK